MSASSGLLRARAGKRSSTLCAARNIHSMLSAMQMAELTFWCYICREAMASVESVKAASDIYAPVSGKVTEVNKGLSDNPAMVNESAEEKAWFVKLEVSNAKEFDGLMDVPAYKAHCDASKH